MKTYAQQKKIKTEKLYDETLIDISSRVHGTIPTLDSTVTMGNYGNIPYKVIREMALDDLGMGTLYKDNGLLSSFFESGDRQQAIKNIAGIIIKEKDTFKHIVSMMQSDVEFLDSEINDIGKIDYNLPDILVDKFNEAFEEMYGYYGEQYLENFETSFNRTKPDGLNLSGLFQKMKISGNNIHGFLKDGVGHQSPIINRFIDSITPMSCLNIINTTLDVNYDARKVFTMKESLIYVLFTNSMVKTDMTNETYRYHSIRAGKAFLTSIRRYENVNKLVLHTDENTIICKETPFKEFVVSHNVEPLIGLVIRNRSMKGRGDLRTLEDVEANVPLLMDIYKQYKNNYKLEFQRGKNIRLRKTIRKLGDKYGERVDDSLMMRMNITFDSQTNVGLDFMHFINGLKTDILNDTEKLIESLYINYIYKDTEFARFYSHVHGIINKPLDNAISQSLYYMTVQFVAKAL